MGWIFRLCIMNMKRRKTRTILTVLGVSIGVISIVSLLSLGIGVKEVMLKDYESGDTVRRIVVYGVENGKRKDKMLTDRTIENLRKISHVETVYPTYEVYTIMKMDKYIGYVPVCGIPSERLEQFALEAGSDISRAGSKPKLVFGNLMGRFFYNDATGSSYMEEENKKTKDMLGKKLAVTIGFGEDGISDKLAVDGVLMGDDNTYTMEAQTTYCDLDVLLRYLRKKSPDGTVTGQPTDSEGNAYKDFIYSNAVVIVDEVDEVDDVVKKLQDMGFQTENEKEYLDSVRKSLKVVQLLLGGIGMIALVVAVIGISNTMMTAVYDRINEIGILKVLGCDLDELLYLFLLEAGILGIAGGMIGVVASYGIRGILNRVGVALLEFEKGTQLAVIPWWLVLAAVVFSTVLGVLAGYFPARWAVKLRPIDAVRKQ
ncbi:MAG: ABC transporter permease [Clostridium sp.]|nr:ABC transporter permease [Clostridium sp.]